jgi:uncharacterized membrane protein YfhO
MLMGVKYIAGSRNDAPIGYELVSGDSNKGVYKNNNVFPLGYASNKLMSKKYFDNLSFPYNLEALLNNVIVNNDVVDISNSNIKPIILNYDYVIDDNLNISKNNDTVIIDNKKDSNITLKLKEPIKNQILLVSFDILKPMNCKDGDTSITINNITNKLTCKQWLYFNDNYHFKYVISSPDDISDINITINKGYMEIKNIETYVLDYDKVSNLVNNLDPLIIDYKNTKGDKIVGNIKVTNDGYFATTIPYDKGFTVLLNNKKIKYEEINNAFIGLPIKKGNYKIEIKYQTPGYIIGLCGSLTGLLIYVIIILKERKKD